MTLAPRFLSPRRPRASGQPPLVLPPGRKLSPEPFALVYEPNPEAGCWPGCRPGRIAEGLGGFDRSTDLCLFDSSVLSPDGLIVRQSGFGVPLLPAPSPHASSHAHFGGTDASRDTRRSCLPLAPSANLEPSLAAARWFFPSRQQGERQRYRW